MKSRIAIETAFHPSRSLRRGWFILTESPILLWLFAAGIVLLENLASGYRDDISEALFLRLERALPMAEERFAWQAWDVPSIQAEFVAFLGPFLLFLLWVRCWIDLRMIRAHRGILEKGFQSTDSTLRGVWFGLFQYRLLAWGLVIGSLILACIPGLLVLWWGIEAYSLVLSVFGLALMLIFGLPIWTYVSMGVYLGDRLLIFEGHRPVEALELSWELASGNRLPLLVFRLVCTGYKALGILLGLLFCGVGVLVTWPAAKAAAEAALSEALLVARGGDVSPAGWKMLVTHEQSY